MEMVNIIGHMDELDKVSMEIVRLGSLHVVNALNEINQNNFTVMTSEQSTDVLKELSFIKPYKRREEYSDLFKKVEELMNIFGMEKAVKKSYLDKNFDIKSAAEKINEIHEEVSGYSLKIKELSNNIGKMQEVIEYTNSLKDIDLDIKSIKEMEFFDFKIGKLTKENYAKLMDNIENISAIVYEVSQTPKGNVIISITPKILKNEVSRVFNSLNYEEIDIPFEVEGTPENVIYSLNKDIKQNSESIKQCEESIDKIKKGNYVFVDECYSSMKLYDKAQNINNEVACTNEFFYLSGWVPLSQKESFTQGLSIFGDKLVVVFKKQSDVNRTIAPPTKLRNNWFTQPFESIVNMYGTPSYNELDPTSFVAISYIIMFGFMFADVGQGFVFLLAGLIMKYKKSRPNLGGVLSRIGASSMIFGCLFGSVFGNEEVIKPLLIRPMENINQILASGIVLGIIFTSIGFIFSLINAFKRKDLEEGIFGKNGLAGMLFYWIALYTVFNMYTKRPFVLPLGFIKITLIVLLALIVVKEPISNLILKRKPLYKEGTGDYYVESGFGLLETLLSMLSNTISFIRIGAFALNHVGLFVAFATVANMVKSTSASIGVLILGNIIIIGLEGLIVFIQGLRLEYYELFSKYYNGDGQEYNPIRLHYSNI
jgi:V/A-type H+-transporting ATPase subunit I